MIEEDNRVLHEHLFDDLVEVGLDKVIETGPNEEWKRGKVVDDEKVRPS